MIRRLALAALLALAPCAASAQMAIIAPTPTSPTESSDRIATTAWVNTFVNAGLPLASGKIWVGSVGGIATAVTPSGDLTVSNAGAFTLATVNATTGGFGSTTACVNLTVNAKGLITNISSGTCTPAIGSITGLGANVATALGIGVGSAGAFVTFNGALGTPSSGTLTNATGLPIAGITGLGTGVPAALAIAVGSAGSPVVNGGALGTPSSGSGANLTALNGTQLTSGTIPNTRTNGHQNGSATNDSAATGEIGEVISATLVQGSAVSLTSGTAANITSISLTAGDWDVFGFGVYIPAATTSITQYNTSISTTTATLDNVTPFSFTAFTVGATVPGAGGFSSFNPGPLRISLSTTTTVFLVGRATFTVSTCIGYGGIRARRVR